METVCFRVSARPCEQQQGRHRHFEGNQTEHVTVVSCSVTVHEVSSQSFVTNCRRPSTLSVIEIKLAGIICNGITVT